MSKNYKKILITLFMCVLFITGLLVVSVSASDINWLAVKYEDVQTQVCLGEEISLPKAKPVYPQKVKSYYFIVEAPTGNVIETEGDCFVAELDGVYKINICVLGYDGKNYTETYDVVVEKSSAPILAKGAVFPNAFLEGSIYKVPSVRFVDYNTQQPTEVDYKVYLVDVDGTQTEIFDTFSPIVDIHGECVCLKYVATSTVTNESKTVTYNDLPVLKPFTENEYGERVYDYAKMFTTTNVESIVSVDKGVDFYGTEDFSVLYANNLNADFNISMMSKENLTNFETLKVTLTDSINKNQFITLEYTSTTAETSTVKVNGENKFLVKGSFRDYSKGFALSFTQIGLKLLDSESKLVTTIKKTADGADFDGFDSQLVKLKIEVKGLSGRSLIQINEINGHGLNMENDGLDTTLPFVFPEKDFKYKNNVGDVVLLSKAIAVDVVDPSINSLVSVYDPFGNVVKDENGLDLYEVDASIDYQFVVNVIGSYTIQYVAEDASYNSYNYGYYSIYVIDTIAPTITVKGNLQTEVSIGGKIKLPEVEVSDYNTESEDIYVFVTVSGGSKGIQYVRPNTEITFEEKGRYHVRFTAIDANNNISTVEYYVDCK